jgi:hypothetical protein
MKNSARTLAIVGLFNPQKVGNTYVFGSQSLDGLPGNYIRAKLNSETFFEEIKPVLGLDPNDYVELGNTIYNRYNLCAPSKIAEAKRDKFHFQIISSDSPLLDVSSLGKVTKVAAMKNHGGQLVAELVENLDKLSSFAHSNFARALLKLARDFIYHATFEARKGAFSQRQWFDCLGSNYKLSSEIVKYLTAYPRDEEHILTAVRAHLANDTSENRLKQDDQEAVEHSLQRLKQVMSSDLKNDNIWQACSKFESNADWINQYAGHEAYGLPILNFVGGRDFIKYYQSFLSASNHVHRLVRSQSLHPYIVIWLASKYAKFDEGEFEKAAKPMYAHGIKGQGDKRIPGETFAERSEMRQRIRDTEIDRSYADKLTDDDYFNNKFLDIAEDRAFNALIAERSVTEASLRTRAKQLFTMLSQLAGGKVGELYRELDAFNQTFVPFYRIIKNTQPDKTDGYLLADFKERLEKRIGAKTREKYSDIDTFIAKILDNAEQIAKTDKERNLKTIITQEFVSSYASVSKNHFAKNYLENADLIQAEIEDTEKLYDLIRNQQQVSSQSELVGTPVVTVVDTSLPNSRTKKAYRESLELAFHQTESSPDVIKKQGGKPKVLKDVEASVLPIESSEGKPLGTVTIKDRNEQTIDYDIKLESLTDLLNDEAASIKLDHGPSILITETDLPLNDLQETLKAKNRDEEDLKRLLKDNAKLSEKQDKIISEYQKDNDKTLLRGTRALMLCEYILAMPKSQSQLGKADVSNGLGLLVDVVENLVDPKDQKVIQDVLVKEGQVDPDLSKINLSRYYPVPEDTEEETPGTDQLTEILTYQYGLATELSHDNQKQYLEELSEIRSFISAIQGTDLTLIVHNSNLEDLGRPSSTQDYLFNTQMPPTIVYLSTQANVESGLESLANTFAKYVATDQLKNFQMPIFISPEKHGLSHSAVPAFDAADLRLDFDIEGQTAKATSGIEVDKFIQKTPYLLLAAAVLLPDHAPYFGTIQEVSTKTFDLFRTQLGLELNRKAPLSQALKDIWLKSNYNLFDTLIFTQWLNLLLLSTQSQAFKLNNNKLAAKLAEVKKEQEKDRISDFHFALGTDYPVLIQGGNNQFVRPELNNSSDMNLNAVFASKHRGNSASPLKVEFKNRFYHLLLENQKQDHTSDTVQDATVS